LQFGSSSSHAVAPAAGLGGSPKGAT
jgi:hypothetical protein